MKENRNKRIGINLSVEIRATLKHVWDVFIKPELWWEGVILEPKIGGKFEEHWGAGNITSGKVIQFIPQKQLNLSWKDVDWPDSTFVTFSLNLISDGITLFTLHHAGWEIFPEREQESLIQDHKTGWSMHLNDLKQKVEEESKG